MKKIFHSFNVFQFPITNGHLTNGLLISVLILWFHSGSAQNVGIGTPTPLAKLHVADNSVVFSADGFPPDSPGMTPINGFGRRMMWFADKAAFRAGFVFDDKWDAPNVGKYSFAAGWTPMAMGENSVAMGSFTQALGRSSVALGENCLANGNSAMALGYADTADAFASAALGYLTKATGVYAVSMGYKTRALGDGSLAAGTQTTANGASSFAMGSYTTASSLSSIAMGDNVTANGSFSTAMGSYVSTSGFSGCLTIGDRSTNTVMQTFVANGFRARFAGGYRLFTNSATTIGAFLNADANSWAALSDVRKKENFLPVDGEAILARIAEMPQYTWNYKGQDVRKLRHYGPMGQDFFKAFGHDKLGEIGCDTLINQQDFLGVNLIAIQALEKRTQEFKIQMEKRTQEIEALKESVFQLRKEINELKKKGK